jgi:ABC-type glutathione transport system ATPase component
MTLSIRDLKVSFGKTQILRGVDLHIEKGDCLALVGESGSGKTTLGLAIMGLARGYASGEISFQGKDLLKLSQEELRELRETRWPWSFRMSRMPWTPCSEYRIR